ncbi:MAG: helix-hairpin-helix domain-containing protein [Anaerolineae bacterium]
MGSEAEGLAEFIDRPTPEEEIRSEERRRFRWYVILTTLVALVAGTVIGRFGFQPVESTSDEPLAPPAAWNTVRPAPSEGTFPPSPTPALLRVYVSGAVEVPGVVEIPQGSLLRDALDAVGGPTVDADLNAINLATPLHDNDHVIVPTLSTNVETETTPPTVGENLININTASAAELETLPHIGPARAQDIIDYRETHGPFASIGEIQQVKGIGPSTFADIEHLITVGP